MTKSTGDPLHIRVALHTALQCKYTYPCLFVQLCSENGGLVRLRLQCVFHRYDLRWHAKKQIYHSTSCLRALEMSMCSMKSVILNRALILQFKTTLPGCVPSAGLCFSSTVVCNFAVLCAWFIVIESGNPCFTKQENAHRWCCVPPDPHFGKHASSNFISRLHQVTTLACSLQLKPVTGQKGDQRPLARQIWRC